MRGISLTSAFVLVGALCMTQAELIYHADFEDGSRQANVGGISIEIWNSVIENQENPDKSGRNTSDRVAFCGVGSPGNRAEISSQRVETWNKTYVYQWSYYIPEDYFTGRDISWNLISQWKTWPCEDNCGQGSHQSEVCYSCGIFNEIDISESELTFAWRAEPDCRRHNITGVPQGEWFDFQQEIHWTNGNDGYYKLWMNGELISEDEGIKTLLDNFDQGRCDIYWAVGVYGEWWGPGDWLGLWVDNLHIYDTSGVTGIIGEPGPTVIDASRASSKSYAAKYKLDYRPDLQWNENVMDIMSISGRRIGSPATKGRVPFKLPAGIYVNKPNPDINHEKARKEPN
ncbi:heparin lyase I family protein [Fibrobacterota bacterium]